MLSRLKNKKFLEFFDLELGLGWLERFSFRRNRRYQARNLCTNFGNYSENVVTTRAMRWRRSRSRLGGLIKK
jgi:hypothetical protein